MRKSFRFRIIRNTSVNTVGKFLSFLLQFFIITYLIKTLGKDAYGLVVLAFALVANTNLLESGFGLSVTKYVAEHKARGEREEMLLVVNTNLAVSTAIGAVFSIVIIVINEIFLNKIFRVPPEMLAETKSLIRILVPLIFIELWTVSIIRVAEGLQRFALARAMELVKWLSRALLVVIFITADYGLKGVGAAYLAAGVLCLLVVYVKIIFNDPELHFSLNLMDRRTFGKLLGFSIWIFFSKVFAFLSYRIDTIIIGIFLAPVYLTYYNVAFKIFEILRYGLSLVASTLVPVSSELHALTDVKRLSKLLDRGTRYAVVLMCPVYIFVFIYMDRIIELWVGGGFGMSALLCRIFIVALFTAAPIAVGTEMMVGLNRMRTLVKYNAVATVVNLVISLYLIRKIGVQGVVIGTAMGSLVILVTYLPVIARTIGVALGNFVKAPLLSLAAAGLLLVSVIVLHGYLGIAVGAAVYVTAAFFIVFQKKDTLL